MVEISLSFIVLTAMYEIGSLASSLVGKPALKYKLWQRLHIPFILARINVGKTYMKFCARFVWKYGV